MVVKLKTFAIKHGIKFCIYGSKMAHMAAKNESRQLTFSGTD